MKKYDPFIGRENELQRLHSLLSKRSASLVVIRGRRRIGKSRLIEEFARDNRFLPFAGIPPTTGITAQDQRDLFANQLGGHLNLRGIQAEDWVTLFSLLARETREGRVIIAFDEISWMASKDPTFLGKLKNAWDLELKKNPELILILCGSVSTWIEQNILSSTTFFGRISLLMKLEELPLSAASRFLTSRGFKGSAYDRFTLLSVTGGIPWYLEQIHGEFSACANIHHLCFQPDGALFFEFERIFHDLFARKSEIYRKIVECLANRPMELKVLCEKLNYAKGGTLSSYLNDLIESGFLSRDITWSLKSGRPSKLSQFRLSDNYLRFYLKYIVPNRNRIERGAFEQIALAQMKGWSTVVGFQFENLILNNRAKIWELLHIHPSEIIADNPFFQRKTSHRKGCQVDYLIQTRYHTLFACEIKFSIHPISTAVIDEMREKLKAITLPKRFSIWPVLIHVNGVSDGVQESDFFSKIIDFKELIT